MTIKYKVGRAMLDGQERLYPRLVVGEKTSGEEFQRKVAQRAARGLADVAAVFIAAREILLEGLRDDQAVQVPGFGIFTASLKGELDDDQRLVTQSARLRINYRPDRDLTEDANADLSFKYVGD